MQQRTTVLLAVVCVVGRDPAAEVFVFLASGVRLSRERGAAASSSSEAPSSSSLSSSVSSSSAACACSVTDAFLFLPARCFFSAVTLAMRVAMASLLVPCHALMIFFHPAFVGTFTVATSEAVEERKMRRSALLNNRGSMHSVAACSVPLALTARCQLNARSCSTLNSASA